MKRFLNAGEGCAPTGTPDSTLNLLFIKHFSASIIFISLFLILSVAKAMDSSAVTRDGVKAAQDTVSQDIIEPLQIGDFVPDWVWGVPLQVVNHPEGKETITLNDYRGKLIVLDFWAIWCSSCIVAMPDLARISEQFSDEMVSIPVSWSSSEDALRTLQTHKMLRPWNLFSVVDAELFVEVFPHKILPHYVWISPEGELMALSGSQDFTATNIRKILDGDAPDYQLKADLDRKAPILLNTNLLPTRAKIGRYAIIIKGAIPGLPGGAEMRRSEGVVHGMAMFNRPLSTLYRIIYAQMLPDGLKTSSKLFDAQVEWAEPDNYYSFDFIVPPSEAATLFPDMLDYLDRYSGLTSKWVKRKMPGLILRRTVAVHNENESRLNQETLKDVRPLSLKERPISALISLLNRTDFSGERIVVDESGVQEHITMTLYPPSSLAGLQTQLKSYGYSLTPQEIEIEVFEIRQPI